MTLTDALVTGDAVLGSVDHEEIQSGLLAHVALGLHAAGPGAADAQPADVAVAFAAEVINNGFDLSAQGQSAAHAVDLLLFVKSNQSSHSVS